MTEVQRSAAKALFEGTSELHPNEVHVWTIPLDLSEDWVKFFKSLLSEEEIARGERLIHAEHQIRFWIYRSSLRLILSHYSGCSPEELQFESHSGGKPFLSHPKNELKFNLSHSDSLALIAVNLQDEIGIDIEKLRRVPEADRISKRYFSEKEQKSLFKDKSEDERKNLSENELSSFFDTWTKKEALIKYTGLGFQFPSIHEVDLSESEKTPLKLNLEKKADPVFVSRLDLPKTYQNDYRGALATSKPGAQIRNFAIPKIVSPGTKS